KGAGLGPALPPSALRKKTSPSDTAKLRPLILSAPSTARLGLTLPVLSVLGSLKTRRIPSPESRSALASQSPSPSSLSRNATMSFSMATDGNVNGGARHPAHQL